VSASLRHPEGLKWIADVVEISALISAVLRICHPELYRAGLTCMDRLSADSDFTSILEVWSSMFNGVSVITNRETPMHRDRQSRPEWYDVLCTFGGDDDTVLELEDLGIWLLYRAGTIVTLSGQLLSHGVCATTAERICYAYWMGDCIHEEMQVKAPGWMDREIYNV